MRRAQTVLVAQQMAQALHHLIGRGNQRLQFTRAVGGAMGTQVALATGLRAAGSGVARGASRCTTHNTVKAITAISTAWRIRVFHRICSARVFTHLQRLCHLDHGHAAAFGTGHRLQ